MGKKIKTMEIDREKSQKKEKKEENEKKKE